MQDKIKLTVYIDAADIAKVMSMQVTAPAPEVAVALPTTPTETLINAKPTPKPPVYKDLIKAAFGVLRERKETDAKMFTVKYLNNSKVADLTEESAKQIYETILTDYPFLRGEKE